MRNFWKKAAPFLLAIAITFSVSQIQIFAVNTASNAGQTEEINLEQSMSELAGKDNSANDPEESEEEPTGNPEAAESTAQDQSGKTETAEKQEAETQGESITSADEAEERTVQEFPVQFTAVDEEGNLLDGASFNIKDELGQEHAVDSHAMLEPGEYTVWEETAPEGYCSSEFIKVTVSDEGIILVNGTEVNNGSVSIVNNRVSTDNDEDESTEQITSLAKQSSVFVQEVSAEDVSAHMHATITSSMDTYESGTTAVFSVKYTLDENSIHEGDYVVITFPQDIASSVSFSLNAQHFSSSEDLGSGKYKLTFASEIESGLSGSFNAYVTTKKVDNSTSDIITVGNASKSITVVPTGSSDGTGTYTDTINKDGFENEGVSYGGYDYSDGDGDNAAQIGVADLTKGGIFKYRIYINGKKKEISNITVIDNLPDGMTFNQSKGIEVINQATEQPIDASLYSFEYRGQSLTFKYPGTFSNTIQLNYWVNIPEGSNTAKYTNTASITYTQNGEIHQEHRRYILQGADNNAANGEKSVDKIFITTDPDDQFVTYTIKFWNSNGFAEGEINLTDQLDSHVKFVSADPNEYFSVIKDSTDPQKIYIKNTKAIDGSLTTFVRFIVDMSDVPVGYTVENTVGGNTTKTTKYDGGLTLSASKLLDGKAGSIQAGLFNFQLLSETGEIIQVKTNDAEGNVAFDRISYSLKDIGKTFEYQVKEVEGNDDSYEYDQSIYTITVTPTLEMDSGGNPTGKILADPVITCGEKTADSIVFNNKKTSGSLKLTKKSVGHETPAETEFCITGPEDYCRTVKYSDLKEGSITLADLPAGIYRVKESKANVDGYTLTVDGDTKAEVAVGGMAEIVLTNTYTPNTEEKISIPITKIWIGGTGSKAVVHLFADGVEVGSDELNAENRWHTAFKNLDQYKDGKEISYSLTEDPVSGYTSEITYSDGIGFTVTNTKKSGGYGAVSLYKVDAETGMNLPGAQFALYRADGTYIGTFTTDSEGKLNAQNLSYGSYYFTEAKAPDGYLLDSAQVNFTLDSKSSKGNDYPLTIKVSDTKSESSSVSISGMKTWVDQNNAGGTRPSIIKLHLLANGTEIASAQTSADQNWEYSFGTFPLNDESGNEIKYSITEDAVPGYTFSQSDLTETDGKIVINVKNTLTPKDTTITKNDSPTGSGGTSSGNVLTGDDTHIILYLLLFSGSIAVLATCITLLKN